MGLGFGGEREKGNRGGEPRDLEVWVKQGKRGNGESEPRNLEILGGCGVGRRNEGMGKAKLEI